MPARFSLAAMGSSTSAAAPFIVDVDCEGTGTPTGWTDAAGSPNWDYTVAPLAGSQSLYLSTNGAAHRTRTNNLSTSYTEIWAYFLLKITNGTAPSVNNPIAGFAAINIGAPTDILQLTTGLKLRAGTSGNATVDSIVIDTLYHVWFHYIQGTGANGVIDVGFSTTGTRPTSGNTFASTTNTTDTNTVQRFFLGTALTSLGVDVIFDNIRVRDSQINDNGT